MHTRLTDFESVSPVDFTYSHDAVRSVTTVVYSADLHRQDTGIYWQHYK